MANMDGFGGSNIKTPPLTFLDAIIVEDKMWRGGVDIEFVKDVWVC